MTRGFWHDPERYLETYWSRLPGIWVHGDWARIDADGFWYILGRSDDTIKVAGKRVGPAEVESAALSHPAVAAAAAIGVPHALKGEARWCSWSGAMSCRAKPCEARLARHRRPTRQNPQAVGGAVCAGIAPNPPQRQDTQEAVACGLYRRAARRPVGPGEPRRAGIYCGGTLKGGLAKHDKTLGQGAVQHCKNTMCLASQAY